MSYLSRLALAALAYSSLPVMAGLLAWYGHPWWSTSVLYLSAGLETWVILSADPLSAVFRGYNNWLVDFCSPYPNRIKGMAMLNVDSV